MIDIYADFETTKTIYNQKYDNFYEAFKNKQVKQFPKVYSWAICYKITNKKYQDIFNLDKFKYIIKDKLLYVYGIDILSFIEFITSIKQKFNIWFHNGSKFDFHFIITALLDYGYIYIPSFENYESFDNDILKERQKFIYEKYGKINKKNWEILSEYEFNSLTDGTKKVFKIQLVSKEKHFDNKKQKYNNVLINLRDSNLLFTGSLKSYGEKLNQIFNTNIYTKKELDYDRIELYENIEQLENDKLEFEYLLQDVFILYSFLNEMGKRKELPRHKWKTTAASTAYSQWENDYGSSYFYRHILDNKNIKQVKNYKLYNYNGKWVKEGVWKKLYVKSMLPVKWLNEVKMGDIPLGHIIHKKYYNGGITLINEKYRGVYLDKVNGYDINSSYPSVMNSENLCPIGEPIYDYKELDFNYYQLIKVEILKPIENKLGLPFFVNQAKEIKTKQYLKFLEKGMVGYLDSNEFKRFLKYYTNDYSKFKIEIFLTFKTKKMKEVFGSFVDKWYKIKQESNDELSKTIAKLMLNSTYGKFGTKILRDKKEFDMKIYDWVNFETLEDARFYLPIATCITSLARCKIIDNVDINYNDFYYCDTDSIYLNANNNFIKNISNKLGDWKLENTKPLSGVFRRPKQYLLRNGIDKDKMVYAGINFGKVIQSWVKTIGFKDFVYGLRIPNQLRSYKLYGTVILEPTIKEVKPIWFYFPNREQIYTLKKHYDKLWKSFELNQDIKFSRIAKKVSKKKFTCITNKSKFIKLDFI